MNIPRNLTHILCFSAGLLIAPGLLDAKPKNQPLAPLSAAGQQLEAKYSADLEALQKEIAAVIPKVSDQKQAALLKAREQLKMAQEKADTAQGAMQQLGGAKALVDHAKNKWIGGADKGIAAAQETLRKASTDAERQAAEKDLAHWQANRVEGLNALKEREANLARLNKDAPQLKKSHETAQAELAKAKAHERNTANSLIADINPFLSSDKLDAKLIKAAVIHHATPRGLAEFAERGADKKNALDQLLANTELMREMLVYGGASFGKYGRAVEIYTAIQKASNKASSGNFQRLALATSLEHAQPISQSDIEAGKVGTPKSVDPVKRYLHYEKAFLDGELDPAFKDLTTWEYRHVVNCDSPDEILAWGRQMLRTYRPDHIYNPDYGWRYVASVKTEVPYGSQNVHKDLGSLHKYQNIAMNGGICGRRAFFGRFILRSFGIPTWGVTQKAHAALSHWTPKGWVVNLGAGYHASWWDKDEVSMSGNQFLQETQAREHTEQFIMVLRAQWVSRALNEPQYNDRKGVVGGFWSKLSNDISAHLASTAVSLGPLGQELGEANEPEDKKASNTSASVSDEKPELLPDGSIRIPAVAFTKPSGKYSSMKSIDEGFQIHAFGGFKAPYEIDVNKAGKYEFSAQVATVQTEQVFLLSVDASSQPIESPAPYTKGLWQNSEPIIIELSEGKNIINFELKAGSRGVAIKDFNLKPTN
jgi:hypothetical protein